jgi:hypothetical protein
VIIGNTLLHLFMYLEELFDNIALNEIKLRDDLSQSVGDLSLADRNWDDLLQVLTNFARFVIRYDGSLFNRVMVMNDSIVQPALLNSSKTYLQ